MNNNKITIETTHTISLDHLIEQQEQERGLTPMPLEDMTFLRRIKVGDWSSRFLGKAFISVYHHAPFEESLGDLVNLDAEGFRLFHQILHIRHVPGWRDDHLNGLMKQVRTAIAKGDSSAPGDE